LNRIIVVLASAICTFFHIPFKFGYGAATPR
jgi:hypothetical protein